MSDQKASAMAYWTGAVTAVLGWAADNPVGAIGAFCTVATFLVNIYFQHRRDLREERQLNHILANTEDD